jgi:SAM-dependent methyltransferase
MPGYTVLPLVYDRWQTMYGRDYSTLILPHVLDTIDRCRVPTGAMLDLACGTGTLAFLMARRGWTVWGVDGSRGMLAAAEAKKHSLGRNVTFLRMDMRALRLPVQVELATCFFDSLNHLPSAADLLKTFRAVAGSLKRGGHFVFDLNNEHCFRTLWTKTEAADHRDFTLILKNTYDARRQTACSLVTLFLKEGLRYQRFQETVRERFFSSAEVTGLLQRSGFIVLESSDFNFADDPSVGNLKTWWVARKE